MNEDISLKSLFLQFRDHWYNLWRSWKFITLCGFGMALLFLALNFSKPRMYTADLTFMLNDDDGGAMGGMTAVLGQFGLGGSGESNLDKVIELSRARTIIQSALFQKRTLNGELDYLANHLIQSLKREKKWKRRSLPGLSGGDELDLTDFRFTRDTDHHFELLENKALKKLYTYMVGKQRNGAALYSEYSELSGIMKLTVTTADPMLSIELVNNIYDELSLFYLNNTGEKQRYDYNIIKTKYDSIQTRLNSVIYSIAKFEDENIGLIRKQDELQKKRLKGEELKLSSMLAEAEKQLQITKMALESNTPFIQAIDKPLPPLRPSSRGLLFYFLLGGFIGGLLSILWVVGRKAFRDVMT